MEAHEDKDKSRVSLSEQRLFYDREYAADSYSALGAEGHQHQAVVQRFVRDFALKGKRCVEVGCGRGAFQDLVDDYTGIDLSTALSPAMHKPFVIASATTLPFAENSFDALWTIAVLEHVPGPELALEEMRRVLKPGGVILLLPAWQCRLWAADGYQVRPYSDFSIKGKLIKASIPIRDSVAFRSAFVFPRRVLNTVRNRLAARKSRAVPFRIRELEANFSHFWAADGDAVNWMDPFDAIEWFTSRGDQCLSHSRLIQQFFVRTGALVFQVRKSGRLHRA